ncbi:protein of unknown function [Candidatus Filomicrobium marinum]|uniref:Uncharacterized protein n=1 Tax=Candidatus Filomicrobium marinum TaxID=1608628 RepID=A0A0D6JF47_9HYPH|nr:hypothetical protein [Candidatus Filomicrobium marinum]CFX24396.1 protein of unknown function [Candidatus Filomicrobium marinum]CPR19161.1 protein of unknown function [Candidatus Filomicrobium marinum]
MTKAVEFYHNNTCHVAALAVEATRIVNEIEISGGGSTEGDRLLELEDIATRICANSLEGVIFQLGLITASADIIVGNEDLDEATRELEAIKRMVVSIARYLQKTPAVTDQIFDYYLSTCPYNTAAAH